MLLFCGKRFPVSNQIKIRIAELATKMNYLVMTWSDLDIDKEVVLHFEIKTAPYIILVHVSTSTFAYFLVE